MEREAVPRAESTGRRADRNGHADVRGVRCGGVLRRRAAVDSPVQDSPPVTYDDVYALVLEDVGHIEGDGTHGCRSSGQAGRTPRTTRLRRSMCGGGTPVKRTGTCR